MKKNNVLIELTPLLDVILIMLFFILVQSEGRMGSFYEETREAFEAELAVFEADLEAFKAEHAVEMEHLRGVRDDYETLRLGLEEDTGIILISIVSSPDDHNERSIVIEADYNITVIALCWNNTARDNAALDLGIALTEKIQGTGNSVIMIVFRFDSASIFRADYVMVGNAIHLQRQFNQLLVAELDVRI